MLYFGYILDATTGKGVPNATVTAVSSVERGFLNDVADANGYFEINVPWSVPPAYFRATSIGYTEKIFYPDEFLSNGARIKLVPGAGQTLPEVIVTPPKKKNNSMWWLLAIAGVMIVLSNGKR